MERLKSPLLSIILPTFNEELSIQKVIKEIQSCSLPPYEIIVVDSCSTDSTREIVNKFHLQIIIEPRRGYGLAIQRGIAAAKGKYILIMDSDFTYPATYISQLITPLIKNEVDLVLGNRLHNKKAVNMKKSHLFGNIILTLWFNIIFLTCLKDTQTGIRAFSKSFYKKLKINSKGIFFPTEFLIKAVKKRSRILELPIPYRFRIGISKLSPLRDGILIFIKILIRGVL
ncbi:MAG: glycosyltransferase family 2 protein [Candidatus Helarchaeota archaeon]